MLLATCLAFSAALMHAGWNLAVKRSPHDRFVALWGQVVLGAIVAGGVLVALGGVNERAWVWALGSAVVHVPYAVLLARAYDRGDFSQVYPLARGGGALAAAIGGIVLLGDDVGGRTLVAIAVVVAGLVGLAGSARGPAVLVALGVSVSIGVYTLLDSQGSRVSDVAYYGLATGVMSAVTISVYGVATGRAPALVRAVRANGWTLLAGGVAQKLTYTLVLAAVRLAPVGYVTSIRESSVVIAALVGAHFLGEGHVRRRLSASAVVLAGLVLMVTTA